MTPEQIEHERIQQLASHLIQFSTFGTRCDVTFFNRKPIFDVKVPEKISLALAYGAGGKKMQQILNTIEFSDGTTASMTEIWMLFPMPSGGISTEELAAVDLSQADQRAPNGKTIREMIREMYQCESADEEERYIRRFLAS